MDEQSDEQPDDICPRPDFVRPLQTQPLSPPIYTSAVYRCTDPDQASRLLSGEEAGYVYSRDGHPNAEGQRIIAEALAGYLAPLLPKAEMVTAGAKP